MLEKLRVELKKYFNEDEQELIMRAYNYAKKAHKGQLRKSGEEYIVHPVAVAYILLKKFHLYDVSSVVAALLHDTIEDTDTTYHFIEENFGREIANLVLGVTDSSNVTFETKSEEERFNNAMILRNMMSDFRIIIIKLADRFHNMSTLEYQAPLKQYNKAIQTLAFYVPFAHGIGARAATRILEDYCFQYIMKNEYKMVFKKRNEFIMEQEQQVNELKSVLFKLLKEWGLDAAFKVRYMNLLNIYSKSANDGFLNEIRGLVTMQIVVETKEECFQVLKILRKDFNYDEISFHNYISRPKYSGFKGIVLVLKDIFLPVKIEIYTKDMEESNEYGYAALVNKLKNKSIDSIQRIITNESDFMGTIIELGNYYQDNRVLIDQVEKELFKRNVRVYTPGREMVVLPEGATILDFAYYIHTSIGNSAIGAYVNGDLVNLKFVLQEGDIVEVLRDANVRRYKSELSIVKTTKARRMIEKIIKK